MLNLETRWAKSRHWDLREAWILSERGHTFNSCRKSNKRESSNCPNRFIRAPNIYKNNSLWRGALIVRKNLKIAVKIRASVWLRERQQRVSNSAERWSPLRRCRKSSNRWISAGAYKTTKSLINYGRKVRSAKLICLKKQRGRRAFRWARYRLRLKSRNSVVISKRKPKGSGFRWTHHSRRTCW